jgi:cytidine deaminase
VLGKTKVGAAAISEDGTIFVGCNIEHPFRCHDVHAEVNAITSMVAGGYRELLAILVVAERELFTPCGGCMDWIFQFGGPSCLVAFQSKRGAKIRTFRAEELMPYYPK